MNILFVIGYDLDRSPWATRPRAILKEIVAPGHQVTVVDLAEPEKTHTPIHPPIGSWLSTLHSSLSAASAASASVPSLPKKGSVPFSHLRLRQRYFTPLDSPVVLWKASRQVLPLLRQADVVHIQKPKILTWAIGRWAAQLGKPIIYDWDDLEGSGGIRSGIAARKVDNIESFFTKHSRALVVASHELERFIQSKYPDHAPLHYGPCGVDPQRFNPEVVTEQKKTEWRKRLGLSDERVILYHGQLEMGDPGAVLLEALAQVREKHKAKLLLIGGGRIQENIINLARSLGLQDAVIATGYVPFNEMPTLLTLADVAVALIPDTLYGRCKSPLKIYEAMAMGLPLVASSVGQAAEVLPGCGVLVRPGDSQSLAEAVTRLLNHPEESRRLGETARTRAIERHNWKSLAETFLHLYEESVK